MPSLPLYRAWARNRPCVIVRDMSEYQITYWRDIPSLVTARAGDETAKASLPQRFQEAIDEAAMRLGESDADAYMAGWRRGEWTPAEGAPGEVADRIAGDLEAQLDEPALTAMLDALGPAAGEDAR
jgi:hypothetical protein